MSLKINFFPLHFIVSLLLLITMVIVFSDTVYVYMSSNIYINGLIIGLFIVCMLWILGVLSYYSRSARVINRLFGTLSPTSTENTDSGSQSVYVSSSIAGTLIDSPITSKVLSTAAKAGKLDVSYADAMIIVNSVSENGDRVLGPSRFLAGIFTMLGLFGTFVGLLQTIDGVGNALSSLSDADNIDIFGLVGLLADPLRGMSVAFSTSLFGLVASLFANYGNYVAAQQLSVFTNKLKNFLTATTGMSKVDPAEIKAEDILLALEDSFNKLSVTVAEKLDGVSEGLFTMARIITRGQDRQEKLTKAMVFNLVKLVELADKLNILDTMVDEIAGIAEENRLELFKYLDDNVADNLRAILDGVDLSNSISSDQVEVSEQAVDLLDELVEVNEVGNEKSDIINKSIQESNDLVDELNGISDSIDSKTFDYNGVFGEMVDILSEANSIGNESNDLSDGILNSVAKEDTLGEAVAAIDEVIEVNKDTLAALEDIGDLANRNLSTIIDIGDLSNKNLNSMIDIGDLANRNLSTIIDIGDLSNKNLNSMIDIGDLANRNLSTIIDIGDLSNKNLNSMIDVGELANENLSNIISLNSRVLDELETSNSMYDNMLLELSEGNAIGGRALRVSEGTLDVLEHVDVNLNGLVPVVEEGTSLARDHLDQVVYFREQLADFAAGVDENQQQQNGLLRDVVLIGRDSVGILSNMDVSLVDNLSVGRGLLSNSEILVDYAVGATEAVETLTALVGEISDGVENFLPNMYDTLSIIKDEMNGMNYVVGMLSDNMYALDSTLRDSTQSIEVFTQVVENLDDRMEKLDSSFANLDNSTYAMNELLQELLPAVYDWVNIMSASSESLGEAVVTLGYIANTAQNMDRAISDFARVVLESNEYIAERLYDINSSIGYAGDMLSGAISEVTYAMDGVVSSVMEAANGVAEIAMQSGEISVQISNVASETAQAADIMLSVVSDFAQLRDMYSEQMSEVSDLLRDTVSTVVTTFDYISNNMVDLNNLVTQVEMFAQEAGDTQGVMRDAMYSIMQTQGVIANDNTMFLTALSERVDYTSAVLVDGMNGIIESLSSINLSTDIQTSKLEQLDYKLGELPDNIYGALGELAGMMNQSQNMVMEMASQNMLNQEIIADLSAQSSQSSAMVADLYQQNSGLQASIYDLSQTFAGMHSNFADIGSTVSGVAQDMFVATEALSVVASSVYTQTEALERNNVATAYLSESLNNLALSNESLRSVGDSLSMIINSFMGLSDTLARIDRSSESMEMTFANYSQNLTNQLYVLSETLNGHLQTFMSKDIALGEQTVNVINGLLGATSDISMAVNSFERLASESTMSNMEIKDQIRNSMEYAVAEIASIKENLGNNISDRIMNEISRVADNQGILMDRLNSVMPQVDNLIGYLYSNQQGGDLSKSGGNIELIEALMALRGEQQSGNARLDIMANAVDTLITEILNSRDVAENILEVCARLAGLTVR